MRGINFERGNEKALGRKGLLYIVASWKFSSNILPSYPFAGPRWRRFLLYVKATGLWRSSSAGSGPLRY
jgi:hypothetical protein